MPKLHIESGPDAGRSVSIESGATLGRDMACAVVLRDASVSRRHARVVFEAGVWRVEDTQSRNGLAVRGARVERAVLRDGEIFQLGDVRVRFEDEAGAPAAEDDEIVLEGEWTAPPAPPPPRDAQSVRSFQSELERTTLRPVAASSAPPSAPIPPAAVPPASRPVSAPTPSGVQMRAPERGQGGAAATRAVLQYKRAAVRPGFAYTDLAQQPAWVKLTIAAVALLFFGLLAWGAFHAASFVKQKAQPAEYEDGALDEAPPEASR